jgi:hypothetical protein
MPLHVSSTVVFIIRRSKLYYTASGIVTLSRWQSRAKDCTGRPPTVCDEPHDVEYNFDLVLETCTGTQ